MLPPPRKAAFSGLLLLDRDGTLIAERGYLADPEGVELVPEAVASLRLARWRGWAAGLLTNQGGIGLGRFGWAELAAVQEALVHALQVEGLALDVALACPYHPRGPHPRFGGSAPVPLGRKPNPGMVQLATRLVGLGPEAEILVVGDKTADVEAGRSAGVEGLRVQTRWSARGRSGDGWDAVLRRLEHGSPR
jgi:D-glycero-D-manno-heptose 1,7-bisphosphate phosphatase